jgi:plasmid maintenance system antidote protein VapI
MPLDFAKAMQLFMGTEEELARALGLTTGDVRSLRSNPQRATDEQLVRLGRVLKERGAGMTRVGEMLLEDHERND